ncbi:MAG: flagellar hook-associated protein FlgK [Oscillospiraceae bacterium]|jgi:flagellar hook-associated protein 1 FlgK|nr:flagellar hook-associated protein FlgK [Oscillospiraceae bacterium]
MRPTFLGFETCRRGLAVNQKAKDITGNNIVNWDTVGYTRQRVDMVSVAPNTTATRYGMPKTDLAGQGVDLTGIAQIRDPFLDKRFREEYGQSSYFSKSTELLKDIQEAIKVYAPSSDENSTSGTLAEAITSFANALTNAAGEADSDSLANLVAVSAKNLTELLHDLSGRLDQTEAQAKYDMKDAVDAYNSYAEKLAAINLVIRDNLNTYGASETYAPNELLDERNLLLDELAQFGDLEISIDKDGMVTATMDGYEVVKGGVADRIQLTENINGTMSMRWNKTGKAVNPKTGSLQAYQDYVNGAGPNMDESGETTERGIRYYRDRLDTFARVFATEMNSIIPTLKTDGENNDNGTPDRDYKMLFGARVERPDGTRETTVDMPITAANIALSDAWLEDPTYVIYDKTQSQSRYYLQMVDVLTNSDYHTKFNSAGENYEGCFIEYVNDYAITLGTDISYNSGRQSATATSANTMMDRRDEVSGVNYDEETQSMMVYSKAYQAIARVLTTMDEALDVLINKTGLVGR